MQQHTQLRDQQPVDTAPDLAATKARIKATWEDGDYAGFAGYMARGARRILEDWRIAPCQRLLDIGCGAGQSAVPAACLGHRVTGLDIAENLIEHARKWAAGAGVAARFDVGDAEDLPYAEASFDVVISMIGAMFAPRPQRVSAEIARVTRPGGRLYMANWTPTSMPAQMFKCIGRYLPPPPGSIPPVLWGDAATVDERLDEYFSDIRLTRRTYPDWHYPFDTDGVVELFRTQFGPVKRAFAALEPGAQRVLAEELETIYAGNSQWADGRLTITGGEYLEVIATRR